MTEQRFTPLEAELRPERLLLSPFTPDDAVAHAAIWTARGGEPGDPARVLERIPALEARLAGHGLGLRMLRLAGERWPIGYARRASTQRSICTRPALRRAGRSGARIGCARPTSWWWCARPSIASGSSGRGP